MNNIKRKLKHLMGYIRCKLTGIDVPSGGVYIGKGVSIVNGKVMTFEKNVEIRPYCDLYAGKIFKIGAGSDIGTRNRIAGNIIIENEVLLGPDNYICSEDHQYQDINKSIINQGAYTPNRNGHSELLIGKGTWIGTHVAIIGDVHIGTHCVIGANSVVTRDIPDYSVVVGSPAKIIKKYNFETCKWEHYKE